MSTPPLVTDFYQRIWNAGDATALPELLDANFAFRSCLGEETLGCTAFWEYVRGVRVALYQYHCDILDCVSEGPRAFARVRFSGTHVGDLRGYQPTGLPLSWESAALFRFEYVRIKELWVLDDLVQLDELLKSNTAVEIPI
jgi:predicted ester cyclase